MAKVKYFSDRKIAVYIYGERYNKHHGKHVLIIKSGEDYEYGFDGYPLSCSKALQKKEDRNILKEWILSHQKELDKAWEDINNGINPGLID